MPPPRTFHGAGAPVAGTDEVQTLTIGGTPTAGATSGLVFKHKGFSTALALWSATNATLLANINAAIQALGIVGGANIVATAGSLTSGVGTILLTFSGPLGKRAQPTIQVVNLLTGTAPTAGIAETTPGVDATKVNQARKGDFYVDQSTPKTYQCTAVSNGVPTWGVLGAQS